VEGAGVHAPALYRLVEGDLGIALAADQHDLVARASARMAGKVDAQVRAQSRGPRGMGVLATLRLGRFDVPPAFTYSAYLTMVNYRLAAWECQASRDSIERDVARLPECDIAFRGRSNRAGARRKERPARSAASGS